MDILSKADYLRVTEVLSMFSDFSMVDPDVMQKAKDRGTEVHRQCDNVMLEYSWDTDSAYRGYLQSFKLWAKGRTFIPKPGRFYDDEMMVSGELDGIYETPEGLVLIDIKTSLRESKTWKLQTSAYSYMAKKHGFDIHRIEVLKLDKEGKPPKVYLYEENIELFKKALELYRYFNEK